MKRIFSFLSNRIMNMTKPHMIYGYRRFDGEFLKNTRISNTVSIGFPQKLHIEDNVFIGHYNVVDASNSIVIGEGCQITNFVSIVTHSSHISLRLYGREYMNNADQKAYQKGEVVIGKYTFVGPHSVIMPDTVIGKGSIVCAYSYVEGKFPDYSVIAGNPAKVIGDTREMDKQYIEMYPDLKEHYSKWAE